MSGVLALCALVVPGCAWYRQPMHMAGRVALSSLAFLIVGAGTSVFSGLALVLLSGTGGGRATTPVLAVAPPVIACVTGLAAAVWTYRRLTYGPQPNNSVAVMFSARMAGGMVAGAGAGFLLVGAYLTMQGHDTGAALGAMLIGAPVGAALGSVLGAVSGFLTLKKKKRAS